MEKLSRGGGIFQVVGWVGLKDKQSLLLLGPKEVKRLEAALLSE